MIVKDNIELRPVENTEYIVELAVKDSKYSKSKDDVRLMFGSLFNEFWNVFISGRLSGVVGYFKYGDVYILEALSDRDNGGTGLRNSIKIGNMMIDYISKFTDKVRTCSRNGDKAIEILCSKLGFKIINFDDKHDIWIYEKELICQ